MLGVPPAVQQVVGQNNNNTLRFRPVCKHHVAVQKPEVLTKVFGVMNSIKGNPNLPEHAYTKQFFNLNANGSRAVVLRRYSQNQSLCDFRRACNLIDDKQICQGDAVFTAKAGVAQGVVREVDEEEHKCKNHCLHQT